jgi:hypothetical protein
MYFPSPNSKDAAKATMKTTTTPHKKTAKRKRKILLNCALGGHVLPPA